MNPAGNLTYDVFVNDPPPQDGVLPNGEPKRFSPMASTLIYGSEDAVLTDPGMTEDQARVLGDWVASKGRNVTDIFITHGHGDHWFAAGLLAERFGARVVATAGTIAQMRGSVATRPLLWDKLYAGLIPPSPVTAVTVPDNRFTLEGHDLVMVDVGHADADDNTVLHVPDLGLVIAGDVIYNGVHMYLGQSAVGGFGPWRDAIDKVEALGPRHIVCGHQNKRARRRRQADDRGDPAVPGRRGRAAAHREHRRRLLQRQDRQVPGLSGTADPVGDCPRTLRRPRAPRRRPPPDHSHLLALTAAFTVSPGSPHASTPACPWARRARWDRPGGAGTTSLLQPGRSSGRQPDDQTRALITAVQRDGTCWCGPTVWQHRPAMRISVSGWAQPPRTSGKAPTHHRRCSARGARRQIGLGRLSTGTSQC